MGTGPTLARGSLERGQLPADLVPEGFLLRRAWLGPDAQRALVDDVLAAASEAPPVRRMTPFGQKMSVAMTNFGPLGWVSDRSGYRYEPGPAAPGSRWPAMPPMLLAIWSALGDRRAPADACLMNVYKAGSRMGLHQDRDEADPSFPVVSISLGDAAVFRIGGPRRRGATRTLILESGDIVVLSGAARLCFHGVDRIISGSSELVPGGGRINLTLRRAAPAEEPGGFST
ncbi:MAG TPA: alpha-ketoglutarate-dependent dioxygenase AlkB [Caulobacteraceae bacterium]|nr:alpha-ketoglutarate-dependent dioxygenase AlkB [Caulobacteraceae bacterium]